MTPPAPTPAPTPDAPTAPAGGPMLAYRPEIDGLRALAVLMVVLYHAGAGVPGGYVGVDVFFVISGYLITSLIWKDLRGDRFTLAQFWERRARRIMPAFLLVGFATLIAGWFIFWPDDFSSLAQSAQAQALFIANIHFKRGGGYFEPSVEHQPLLHVWSLSVEEQFYMVVPIGLLALYRYGRLVRPARVIAVLAILLVSSFVANVDAVKRLPPAAFYLLPDRGWELLTGSILALGLGVWPVARQRWREAASIAGLAMIVASAFIYDKTTPFPGFAALPPCLGAALVIWADAPSPTRVGRALALRPVVFVGLISYSLYLWHWPLLAFSRYASAQPLSPACRLGLIVLAFMLAVISWRWVETPFRRRRVCRSRRAIFALTAAGLVGLCALGGAIRFADGVPSRLGDGTAFYEAASHDTSVRVSVGIDGLRADKLTVLGRAPADAPVAVLLWGDSHAMAVTSAVDALCSERRVAGRLVARPATPPILGYDKADRYNPYHDTLAYSQEVINYVRAHRVRHVILAAYWYSCPRVGEKGTADFDTGLIATVHSLVEAGARPWIVLQIPVQSVNVPRTLAAAAIAHKDLTTLGAKPDPRDGLSDREDHTLVDRLTAAGATVLDPRPRFAAPAGGHSVIHMDQTPLYYDSHHLTNAGARLTILPLLRDTLGVALGTETDPKQN